MAAPAAIFLRFIVNLLDNSVHGVGLVDRI
jgi:hypothetical protein